MAESIGVLNSLEGSVIALSSDGQERVLGTGDPIFEGDVIKVNTVEGEYVEKIK